MSRHQGLPGTAYASETGKTRLRHNAPGSKRGTNMLVLKYLLVILGIGLFGSSGALVAYDIYLSSKLGRLLGWRRDEAAGETQPQASETSRPLRPVRWGLAQRLALAGVLPLLVAFSIAVVPDGFGGVRVSQLWGARPGTLYPGVHLIAPLVDSVELYDTREQVYTTAASNTPKTQIEELTVQAREGVNIGLAVSVRYRLAQQRLSYIHANLPRAIGDEVVAPTVATIYRQLAPNYITREIFATKREELRLGAANAITTRLATDGIIVREVLLRDLKLPAEYAQGLEGLLLKEQENERLGTETETKHKQRKMAEREPEPQKTPHMTQAQAPAQVRVLQAKPESDSMQYTLPLKQKQIDQHNLATQARKEATLQNAEPPAQAEII